MRQYWHVCALLLVGCSSCAGCGSNVQGSITGLPQRAGDIAASHDLGFNGAFEAELTSLGPISPDEFQRRYAPPKYLGKPTWDPTTAKFWEQLMQDPKEAAAQAAKSLPADPRKQLEALRERKSRYCKSDTISASTMRSSDYIAKMVSWFARDWARIVLPIYTIGCGRTICPFS